MSEDLTPRQDKAVSTRRYGAVALVLAGVLFVLALLAAFGIGLGFQQSAKRAQEQTLSLSQEVQSACKEGAVRVADQKICNIARQAQAQVEADVIAGPPGPRGIQGEPGSTGPRGPAGEDGAPGEAGVDGTDGSDGAEGPEGEPGEPGPTGADGEDGSAGARGATGLAGADGQNGAPGPAGPSGPAGPVGPSGPAGPAGQAGSDGVGIRSIECVGTNGESYWSITMTNDATVRANGPCKATTITVTPEPTSTP